MLIVSICAGGHVAGSDPGLKLFFGMAPDPVPIGLRWGTAEKRDAFREQGRWSVVRGGAQTLWVAPVLALCYSRYMATAKPPETLAASLRHRHKRIDEMRASARMRARLMKKIPRPVGLPPRLVEATNPGPRQSFALVGGAPAARHGHVLGRSRAG